MDACIDIDSLIMRKLSLGEINIGFDLMHVGEHLEYGAVLSRSLALLHVLACGLYYPKSKSRTGLRIQAMQ